MQNVLEAHDLVKTYRGGDGSPITVLNGVDLTVARAEMVAVVGASGTGKSSLLHVLGALDHPNRGTVRIAGADAVGTLVPDPAGQAIGGWAGARWWRRRAAKRAYHRSLRRNDEALATLRNRKVGFVFQFHHLLREFSALENVMMPLRIAGEDVRKARGRGEELLARVGLEGRMEHRPSELSGGEQQRTAVARALAMDPAVLLADEPSGNLDHANAERLHDLFAMLARDLEIGIVVVTHNRSLAGRANRVLLLEDGKLTETDALRAGVA
jgi:lipoprotein-releasing system ATP-binding protein